MPRSNEVAAWLDLADTPRNYPTTCKPDQQSGRCSGLPRFARGWHSAIPMATPAVQVMTIICLPLSIDSCRVVSVAGRWTALSRIKSCDGADANHRWLFAIASAPVIRNACG